MTDSKDTPADFNELRERAGKHLQEEGVPPAELSPDEAARLIHELRVHQVELEMQNEELRQAQAQLEESRTKYVDLYDFAPIGYLSLDKSGRIIEANLSAATILGVARGHLLERYFWQFLEQADSRAFMRMVAAPYLPERQGEFRLQADKGKVRTMFVNLSFSQETPGPGICRLTLTDISDLKQAQQNLEESRENLRQAKEELEIKVAERTEALRDANSKLEAELEERRRAETLLAQYAEDLKASNAELEQFAYVASHDLQEPLRMVASFARLLAESYRGKLDQDADEFIGFVVDGANRMQVLINDILVFSRVGTRGKPLTATDCEKVLSQTLGNLNTILQETGAVVTHDPLPTVRADAGQLGQLFQNLLANALKFRGPDQVRVHIAARRQRDEWIFSIQDNGIGIAPEHQERIFAIFQRLHRREEYPGTGIGLAICKKIVERHGGRIWVESQPGQGATFYFSMPEGEMK